MPRFTQAAADQAYNVRTQLETDINQARNDKTLSPRGRAQKVAKAWQTAQAGMEGVRADFQGGQALTAQDIKQQVFGGDNLDGPSAISVRDAWDRAAQTQNPTEAAALLRQAQTTGDDRLAAAVAAHAFENSGNFLGAGGWPQVVNEYTETRPEVGAKLQQLIDAQSNTVKDSLDVAGHTFLLKPDEIARASEYQIEQLAAGSDPWGAAGEAHDAARAAMVQHFQNPQTPA